MKKNLKPKAILSPMMVQMIATYNDDGSVNLMNAAWGGQLDDDLLVLSLDKSHKTVPNMLSRKAFTLGLPSSQDIVDCDYVGIVSGNRERNKFAKTHLTAVRSQTVDAPVIEQFPLTFECAVFKVFDDEDLGFYVVAKVRNILINEEALRPKGAVDVEKMNLCFFSPLDNTYRAYGEVIAKAFSAGLERK